MCIFSVRCVSLCLVYAAASFSALAGSHVAEEVAEQGAALVREDAVRDLNLVVELLHLEEVEDGPGAAGLGVGGADDDAVDARLDKSAGTHLAGLERDVHRAALEAPVAELAAGLADRDDLGVRERGVRREAAVEAAPDDPAVTDDDTADRDLAESHCALGLVDRFAHEKRIVGQRNRHSNKLLSGRRAGRRVRRSRLTSQVSSTIFLKYTIQRQKCIEILQKTRIIENFTLKTAWKECKMPI